jgi:hypothetical protein
MPITTADEHLEVVKQKVQEALTELIQVTILRCWGHDEYTQEYKQRLKQAQYKLDEIKELLG